MQVPPATFSRIPSRSPSGLRSGRRTKGRQFYPPTWWGRSSLLSELESPRTWRWLQSNSEIARELCIGERTVKAHLSSIMMKWESRDRVQVLIKASQMGIVTI